MAHSVLPGWNGLLSSDVPPSVDEFIADDGSNTPMYASVHSPAFYDAGLNKTFISWEAWTGVRSEEVTSFDHTTRYFSPIEGMGRSYLVDDDHGNPVITLDHENHLHAFYGAHANLTPDPKGMKHSSTRWPVDGVAIDGGSKWAIRPDIAGMFTYPHPVLIGSGFHLFMRVHDSPATSMPLVLYKTTALTDGVATWDVEQRIVDFGADSRVYQGTAILVGSYIYFVATRGHWDDVTNERINVYMFRYNTLTGALENHDGSFSVATGSLPMTLAQANANCRLFEHTGGKGCYIPVMAVDSNGDLFAAFSDGVGTSYDIRVMKRTAGVWGASEIIGHTDLRFNHYALCPLPNGSMELYYTVDPLAVWAAGGDLVRRVRSPSGAWGNQQLILAATDFALHGLNAVRDAHMEGRLTFCERLGDPLDTTAAAGQGRVYLWGSRGLIPYRQEPEATVVTAADGNELREAGDFELREDGSKELREVPV